MYNSIFLKAVHQEQRNTHFKIPKMLYVNEGYILRNTNYQNAPMRVVKVFDYPVDNFYNGFILKELLPIDTQIENTINKIQQQSNKQ